MSDPQPLEHVFAAQLTGGGLCPNCGMWGKQHHAKRCYLTPSLFVQIAARIKCWRKRKDIARSVARYVADPDKAAEGKDSSRG